MSESYHKNVIEAALLAAGKSLQVAELAALFSEDETARPAEEQILSALRQLGDEYAQRALELKHTASGWRVQVRSEFAPEVSRLWPERPSKYSRALLETLALIAYRQPITRGEIETVRGVAVNPNIIKTLLERNWVHVVGTRDVPGRPEILGTTKEFLDHFGLRHLEELPPLAELKSLGELNVQLELTKPGAGTASSAEVDGGGAAPPAEVDGAGETAVAGIVESEARQVLDASVTGSVVEEAREQVQIVGDAAGSEATATGGDRPVIQMQNEAAADDGGISDVV